MTGGWVQQAKCASRARGRSPSRVAVVLLATALTAAGCGGGSDAGEAAKGSGSTSPSASATGGSSSVAAGSRLTRPGTKLAFGQPATVAYLPKQGRRGRPGGAGKPGKGRRPGTVLQLTVRGARQGRLSDLAGFNLTGRYQRQAHYYYVPVTVRNAGKRRVGRADVPLWGISDDNTLLPAVRFTSSFDRCPSRQLPRAFAPGDRFRTCLVYLSPDRGSLEGVSYRPTASVVPIEWHGKVAPPPPLKDEPRKKAKPGR